MPNLKQIVYSLNLIGFLSLFTPTLSYAEEVDLPCCTEESCPTEYRSLGERGVIQTAVFKGVSVVINGERDLLTTVLGDDGYREWRAGIRERFDKDTVKLLNKASCPDVFARCSGSTNITMISRQPKTITCPEGEGIFIEQDELVCEDPETGPHGVVEITKMMKEEHLKQEIASLENQLEDLNAAKFKLNAEKMANTRRIGENNQALRESAQRLTGVSKQASIAGSGF